MVRIQGLLRIYLTTLYSWSYNADVAASATKSWLYVQLYSHLSMNVMYYYYGSIDPVYQYRENFT